MTAKQRRVRGLLPAFRLQMVGMSVLMASVLTTVRIEASATKVLENLPDCRQRGDTEKLPMLSDDEIQLLHVYEIKFSDEDGKPPKVSIPNKILKEVIDKYRDNDLIPRGKAAQARFYRSEGYKQLQLLFDLKAREFYQYVRIKTPNQAFRQWAKLHQSYVLGYFGDHFGDGEIPGLSLLAKGRDTRRIALTNFYLLTQAKIDGVPLIDRHNPSESLLLQWGLPREEAKFAAPKTIEQWVPYYKDEEDDRFVAAVKWIESLVATNQDSTYGITFSLDKKTDDESDQ